VFRGHHFSFFVQLHLVPVQQQRFLEASQYSETPPPYDDLTTRNFHRYQQHATVLVVVCAQHASKNR
ncbi:unnamed protein product, partial [Amoebophrya sp. A25]